MPVSKTALREFLHRPLRDSRAAKGVSDAEIDERLASLDPQPQFDTKPFLHQKIAFYLGARRSSYFFMLDLGLGKGHPYGTKILTPTGWKNVEKMTVGSKVIGQDGLPKTVLGVHERGVLPVYRVTFNDKTSVLCDEEHLWHVHHVVAKTRGFPPRVESVRNLINYGVRSPQGQRMYHIPICEPVQFAHVDLPIDPYILGVLLADGNFSTSIVYTPGDVLVPAEVAKVLPDDVVQTRSKDASRRDTTATWSFKAKKRSHRPNRILAAIRELKLHGCRSYERFIPHQYKFASVGQRIALLQGLMDCDGYIMGSTMQYSTSSARLCEDIKFLVESLGGVARRTLKRFPKYTHNGEDRIGRPSHILTINLPPQIQPLRAFAHKFVPKTKYHPARLISDIEFVGHDNVVCISVEEQLYLTEHCIVTHNSWCALNLIKYWGKPAVVFVPGTSNIGAWREEAHIHTPHLKVLGLDQETREERLEVLEQPCDVLVLTYMGWLHLICGMVDKNGDDPSSRKKMQVIPKLSRRFAKRFRTAVWDESDAIKGHKSTTFKASKMLGAMMDHRILLTGTPFDKDPIDLWSQFYVLDRGETLGSTLGLYRDVFFDAKPASWWGGIDYTFNGAMKKHLRRMIAHSSIRYKTEECYDLPKTTGGILSGKLMIRPVRLSREAEVEYDRIVRRAYDEGCDELQVENVYVRLRQICSGFIPFEDDDGAGEIVFEHNYKLDALMDLLLHEIPEDSKVIVYNEFRPSGRLICERLEDKRMQYVRVFSKTKRKSEVVDRFKQDPKCRILVGSRAICYGLNLQHAANYIVVYESPDSTIRRKQLEGRIVRTGQKRRTYIWDLATRGTVEMRMLRSLEDGVDLFDSLVDNLHLLKRKSV